jgi:hypothetical protein
VVRALLAAITLAAVTASIVVADEPAPPAADCATYSAFDHFAHLIQCPSNTSLSYYRVRAPIAPYDGSAAYSSWDHSDKADMLGRLQQLGAMPEPDQPAQ